MTKDKFLDELNENFEDSQKGLLEDEDLYKELVGDEEIPEIPEDSTEDTIEEEVADIDDISIEDDMDIDESLFGDYERDDYWEDSKDGYEGVDLEDL